MSGGAESSETQDAKLTECLLTFTQLLCSKYSFDDIRIYLILRAVNVYTPYLASAFADAKMVLNDDLYGMTEKSPRNRKCYFLVVRQFKVRFIQSIAPLYN